MSKSVLSSVSQFIVYLDGNQSQIDWDSTFLNFQSFVMFEMEMVKDVDQQVESALDRLFDKVNPGISIPTPVVVTTVANDIANGDLEKSQEMTHIVQDFLSRSKRFESRRGRSGGLVRIQ